MSPSRSLLLAALLVALAPGAAGNAFAGPRAFNAVVREVESHYHAQRTNRFLMWVAGMAVGFAHPQGVLDLKVALFEDQDFSPRPHDAKFESALQGALADDWTPLVRTWSKHDSERAYIYARNAGENVRLFIVSIEAREAVVMEVKVNGEKFAEMLNHPGSMGSSMGFDSTSHHAPTGPPVLKHRDSAANVHP